MPKTDEDIVKALEEAKRILSEEGVCPENAWVPGFGWILRDGKPTENYEAWSQYTKEQT